MTKHISHVVLQPDQKELKFYADKQQALIVFDALIERLRKKGLPYNFALVPQTADFFPSNIIKGSVEHSIFLFVLCFWMRGGVESDTATFLLKEMYEKRKGVFVPSRYEDRGKNATKRQIASIKKVLREFRLSQRIEENALGWVYNMRKLARFWQGDPRKLMDDKPNFKTLTKRIMGKTTSREVKGEFIHEDRPDGFMLFREKMVAMIAYFLVDAGLVPIFYVPVPVDFHVLRLLTSNQVLRVENRSAEQVVGIDFMRSASLHAAREITEWYCRERKVSPIALCDSLWLLSRTFCRNNPGNSGYVTDDKRKNTLRQKRRQRDDGQEEFGILPEELFLEMEDGIEGLKGRKRYLGLKWDKDTMWESKTRIKRFENSCGSCLVKMHCKFNISSGAYYVGGRLLPERLRAVPPEDQSHFFGEDGFGELHPPVIHPNVRFAPIDMAE